MTGRGEEEEGDKERWNVYHYPTTIIYIISIAIEVVVVVAADVAGEEEELVVVVMMVFGIAALVL